MITFELYTSSGLIIPTSAPGWNLTVFGIDGNAVAFYDIQSPTQAWTVGGTGAPAGQESVLLTSPGISPLSGDSFVASISSYGTNSMTIP
jgi:hypothetical protein